jgi:hypothetical protein
MSQDKLNGMKGEEFKVDIDVDFIEINEDDIRITSALLDHLEAFGKITYKDYICLKTK